MKSNFEFLKDSFPVLANFGELAEKYLYSDSNSCLMKLGMIGETIVNLIFTYFYERLLSSKNKEQIAEKIQTLEPAMKPEDVIRDPYVLEFLGLPPNDDFYESKLEQTLITHLQKFLLELGRGFSFVARQKRITFDGQHFRIDLVFYNYILKCFVLLDLKVGDLTHQDLGQMQIYVHYYERELMNERDNPPIGIVLCADKSESVVKYTLPENETQIFAW